MAREQDEPPRIRSTQHNDEHHSVFLHFNITTVTQLHTHTRQTQNYSLLFIILALSVTTFSVHLLIHTCTPAKRTKLSKHSCNDTRHFCLLFTSFLPGWTRRARCVKAVRALLRAALSRSCKQLSVPCARPLDRRRPGFGGRCVFAYEFSNLAGWNPLHIPPLPCTVHLQGPMHDAYTTSSTTENLHSRSIDRSFSVRNERV